MSEKEDMGSDASGSDGEPEVVPDFDIPADDLIPV